MRCVGNIAGQIAPEPYWSVCYNALLALKEHCLRYNLKYIGAGMKSNSPEWTVVELLLGEGPISSFLQ